MTALAHKCGYYTRIGYESVHACMLRVSMLMFLNQSWNEGGGKNLALLQQVAQRPAKEEMPKCNSPNKKQL